ncbi:MAG: TonB-dependent receptor plug domain-containing protein, partial [Bacteroidota bacterium]
CCQFLEKTTELITKQMLKKYLLLICATLLMSVGWSQKKELLVVDENQEPLMGVNIYCSNQNFTATTDVNGKFTLPTLEEATIIHFSYLGYQAQKISYQNLQQKQRIQLQLSTENLAEILIVGRKNESAEELPYQIERISQKAISSTNSSTSANALRDHAGVFVQKSQGGGGSPILRGFEANKVLLVVDGVRMNNAIYRNGHLQNAITIDAAMLDQMEVIYGPGSLTYGSDALGGVIHFRSKNPQFSYYNQPNIKTNFYTRYASVNQEKSVHLDFNFGKRNWASLTSLTYTDFGDIRAGNNYINFPEGFGQRPFYVKSGIGASDIKDEIIANDDSNIQVGTAYNQIDVLQKISYQANDYNSFIANFQYSTSSDVPRYDRLTAIDSQDPSDLRFAEWYYGPQQRLLASLQAKFSKSNSFYDKALFIAAYQKIDEERFDRRLGRTGRSFQLEDVQVVSLTADLDKFLSQNQRHTFSYGLDWNFNDVQSEAGVENLLTNEIERSEPTRYPSGGSQMNTFAAYTTYRWKSRDSILNFHGGLRYTHTNTYSLFSESDPIQWSPSYYVDGVDNMGSDLTWGIGLTVITPSGWQVRTSAASSFRAPNLDDFSKIRVKDGFVTIPNPELSSEKTINGELTIGKESRINNSLVQLSGTAFYTYLQDAIVRTDFGLPDGSFTLQLEDEILSTVANTNAESAFIYGAAANLKVNFNKALQLFSNINWTYGRRLFTYEGRASERNLQLPLAHIPPLYGRTSLKYEKGGFSVEGVLRYNGAKTLENYAVRSVQPNPLDRDLIFLRDGTADNLEQTAVCEDGTFCLGTPAWMTYNLYASYRLKSFTLQLGMENITDVHYRPFASGVSGVGRNLIVALRGSF